MKDAPPSHRKMLSMLRDVFLDASNDYYLGDARARTLRGALASLPKDAAASERFRVLVDLAKAEVQLGREEESLRDYEAAYELVRSEPEGIPGESIGQMFFEWGVAYMRRAETQNCCARYNADSCLFPIRKGGVHSNKEGSTRAIERFTWVLQHSSPGSSIHNAARWLLNIAHMTLETYPDGVPKEYLIPPRAFESEEPFPKFPNIARELGLDTFSNAGGAIGDDFDNDGFIDLLVSTWNPRGQIRYYRNNADGTFTDRTEEAGLMGILGGLNLVQADYDNDGDVDALVLRGAWLGLDGAKPNSLLRNEGDGTFTDVTVEAGLADVHYPTQTASWGDYDNDGDVDLFVGNEYYDGMNAPCQLFRNEGSGRFTDVAADAGVTNNRFSKSVIWGDYDGDRWPDLYVSNFMEPNRLYHNNRDGTFTDVAEDLGVDGPLYSFPSWFWDYDNDGALDLFVSAYSASVDEIAKGYLGLPPAVELARLYRGDGRGGFRDVTRESNLTRPTAPMGSNFGDLDHDGYQDFYLGTGYPDYKELMPNTMYHNRRGKGFADVSNAGGFGHLQKGHAIVFADFDHDGDQDVFEEMGGAFAGDKFRNAFYENPGFGNHWIAVKLTGDRTNRSAIGARIRVEVVEDGQRRSVYKWVNSGGTFGANPMRQTIGLGRAERVVALEVYWPTSDVTQSWDDVPLDRLVEIREGEQQFDVRSLQPMQLGG